MEIKSIYSVWEIWYSFHMYEKDNWIYSMFISSKLE